MCIIPFSHYVLSCSGSQQVTISIVENFNNKEYAAKSLELLIAGHSITFEKARLVARSSLFGVRYYMREWMFLSAAVVILILAGIFFVSTLVFYLIVRETVKSFLMGLVSNQ